MSHLVTGPWPNFSNMSSKNDFTGGVHSYDPEAQDAAADAVAEEQQVAEVLTFAANNQGTSQKGTQYLLIEQGLREVFSENGISPKRYQEMYSMVWGVVANRKSTLESSRGLRDAILMALHSVLKQGLEAHLKEILRTLSESGSPLSIYNKNWKSYEVSSRVLTNIFRYVERHNLFSPERIGENVHGVFEVCMNQWRDQLIEPHLQSLLKEAKKALDENRDAAQTFVDSCKSTGLPLDEIRPLLDHPLIWDDNGDTKLHKAIKEGNLDKVEKLVKDGRRKDRLRRTPLLVACEVGNPQIVAVVLEKFKEDLNVEDSRGNFPVTVAKSPEISFLLQDAGVDWSPLKKRSDREKEIASLVAGLKSSLGHNSFAFTSFLKGSEMIRKKREGLRKDPSKPFSFGFRGYRFPYKEGSDHRFQEVVFVLINEDIVFGMLCEEYPSEKRAYLSYLEARYSGLGLARIVITEYAKFLSVRYPDISLHIWADPPPEGVNYIFRGSKLKDFFGRPPAQPPVQDPGEFVNSLQKEYHKYLTDAKFKCQVFRLKVDLPQPPTFLSNADKRKFRALDESIKSMSTALDSLINVHFEATLVCLIQSGIKLDSETGDEKEYLKSDFLLDPHIDFDKDAQAAQKFLLNKLDGRINPIQGGLDSESNGLGQKWHTLAELLLQQ